jgi:hypothetical protein
MHSKEHDAELQFRADLDGLELDCLWDIATSLPKLEKLSISFVASNTSQLGQKPVAFPKLHTLEFIASFPNFGCPGFTVQEAVTYVSSLLKGTAKFTSKNGAFFLPDADEAYWWRYDTFVANFAQAVCVSLKSRADERARLLQLGVIPENGFDAF